MTVCLSPCSPERLCPRVRLDVPAPLGAVLQDGLAERALVAAAVVVVAVLVHHQQLRVRKDLAAELAEYRLGADVVLLGPGREREANILEKCTGWGKT